MEAIQENKSLRTLNTFAIDVKAAYFATFISVGELNELLIKYRDVPAVILGGGSNVLFKNDFPGLVLKNEITGITVVSENDDEVLLQVGAGENWHQLVLYTLNKDWGGLENLSLIPGNVGASPMQNIGAYGVEIKDVFEQLEAWDTNKNVICKFSKAECHFEYRESVFKNIYKGRFIILNVTFRLSKRPVVNSTYGAIKDQLRMMSVTVPTIRNISDAVINIRKSKLPDPLLIGNAGSFFKNPTISDELYHSIKSKYLDIPGFLLDNGEYKIPAAWLIEQCGWKGYRKGDAGCHINQPLVLVNYGNANGKEILELAEEIIQTVYNKFGVLLHKEVNII